MESVEQQKELHKLDNMEFHQRQQILLDQAKKQNALVDSALSARAEAALAATGKNVKGFRKSKDLEGDDLEQVQMELEQVEDRVLTKHEIEEKLANQETMGDAANVLTRVIAREKKKIGEQVKLDKDNLLNEFIKKDHFGTVSEDHLNE